MSFSEGISIWEALEKSNSIKVIWWFLNEYLGVSVRHQASCLAAVIQIDGSGT